MEAISDNLFNVLIGSGIVVFFGLIIYFALRGQQPDETTKEAWRQAAAVLGLRLKAPRLGFPSLHGTINGRQVKAKASPRSASQQVERETTAQTRYTATHKNQHMPLLRLSANVSPGEIVGDPAFDRMFSLGFAKTAVAKTIFADPDLRQSLMALHRPIVHINRNRIALIVRKIENDPEAMHVGLQLAVALAENVEQLPHLESSASDLVRWQEPS